MKSYPLRIFDDRELSQDYSGRIYIWDIDKTYLSTRFSSVRGLARIPVEFAIDKRAIPGMPEVLRGLRRGPGKKYLGVPLYFISASPPFLKSVLENKMLMDGVEQDGFIFKDWKKTLLELRPGRLWDQLGFKMCALLTGRLRHPMAREYLFGDDTERDAWAFSLYANVLTGETTAGEMESVLHEAGVPGEDRERIQFLLDQLPAKHGLVEGIFIHLEHRTPPDLLRPYHRHLRAVQGGYQLSLALFELGLVDAQTVRETEKAIKKFPKNPYRDVEALRADAQKRKLISANKLKVIFKRQEEKRGRSRQTSQKKIT